MVAFILAAGFGTRLKPITDAVPKALVPVCGEPLLAHNLRTLDNAKVFSAIGVNSHYLHEQLAEYQKRSSINFELFHEKEKIYGTGGALYFARKFLARDEMFMVANVDILHNFDIAALSQEFAKSNRICALVSVATKSGRGTILYDTNTRDFLDVSANRNTIVNKNFADANFTGVTFYRREFLNIVNADDFSVIPIWKRAAENGNVPAVIFPNGTPAWWRDIGTHEALKQIENEIKSGAVVL